MTDMPDSPYLATSDDAVGVAAYPITGRFRLADGRLVWLRPLWPEDAPRLMDLKRLSPSTINGVRYDGSHDLHSLLAAVRSAT
jgi:hypothetical protein